MLVEIMKVRKEEVTVVTSLDVAETFGKEHRNVLADIRNIQSDISSAEFSALFYEETYTASNGKKNPMYYMNRDGFTLLVMGYTGEKAMQFKLAYIIGKIKEREKGIAVRQALTKAIQQSGENDRMHGHAYSTYTDLIYKAVLGKSAKQLRDDYGIGKQDNLRDFLTVEELAKVKSVEMIVSGLVDCGWGYDEIKGFITDAQRKLIAA